MGIEVEYVLLKNYPMRHDCSLGVLKSRFRYVVLCFLKHGIFLAPNRG